jgi:pimeloyl-ACP methyl ester carboxylesterase
VAANPAEGDTVRIAIDGLAPVEGVVEFANYPHYLGVCTPDGMYVFMRGLFDTAVVELHSFAGVDPAAEPVWQSWLASLSVESGYAPVNGLRMYYEIHGTGQPIVLLHGSLSGIGTSFGEVLPLLAKTRQVIAVEMQAHGRTADIDRPLRIEDLASDAVALLRHLGIESADFFGYSLGSAVALRVAIDHPSAVRKLVLASVSYTRDGLHPGLLDGIDNLKPEQLAGSPFEQEYASIAPNPDDWPVLIEKIKRLDHDLTDIPADTIRAIPAPALLVIGDSDIIRPEHAVEMFRLFGGGVMGDAVGLPRSRLAVLPGTTHLTLVHRADWLSTMLTDFLA